MKTIWKVQFRQAIGFTEMQFPEGAKVLSIHNQYQQLVMYIEVETDNIKTPRTFLVVETGKKMPEFEGTKEYIGTALFDSNTYVIHIYEIKGE